VIVLIENRLIAENNLSGTPLTKGDLISRLETYRFDLYKDGFTPRFVVTSVYNGTVHQDGRTVLAIREFFRAIKAEYPNFAGECL
jgi:hypothetical protein